MSNPASLPLSDLCSITTSVTPNAVAGPSYSAGLILTTDTYVPSQGPNSRVQSFSSAAQILAAGALSTSTSYLAAQVYFSQSPAPGILYIGRQDLTAIATATVAAGGTGYVVGDIVTVTQTGASAGQFLVSTIGAGGAVTGLTLVSGAQGTGYTVANALPTSGGTGTGLTVNLTVLGETPVQAISACRATSSGWYGFTCPGAALADKTALMAWSEAATPDTMFFFHASDAASLGGSSTSIIAGAQGASYQNSFAMVATTQGGGYPSNAHMGSAVMGRACALVTGLAGSAFNFMYKTLTGVYTEPVTSTQLAAIKALNANVYVSRANGQYSFVENGITPSGQYLDQVMLSRNFVSDLRYALVAALATSLVVPQTDPGQQIFNNAATVVCNNYRSIGWIAAGVYSGPNILNLTTGQALPSGFFVQSDRYANQLPADRAARKAMPVYVTLLLAGAVDYLTVGVSIQR